jgi:hypothetical protein
MNIWEFGFLATIVVGAAILYAPNETMELVKSSVRKIRRKA